MSKNYCDIFHETFLFRLFILIVNFEPIKAERESYTIEIIQICGQGYK